MNPKVDFYFHKANKWQTAVAELRAIILDCGELTEELKWGEPCYTYQKSNIVLIHSFKEYCALLFFKGALLQDTHGILIQQTQKCASSPSDSVYPSARHHPAKSYLESLHL